MVICFDAGNTDLVAGLFCDDAITDIIRIPYKRGLSAAEYYELIKKYMQDSCIDTASVEGCLLCCVAKGTADELSAAIERLFGSKPVIFKNDRTCRLDILTEDPYEVGTDIIAGCMAAKAQFPMPCIVIDMGTATTMTAMDRNANVLGVSILTGVFTSMKALKEKTGLPFEENIEAQPKAIGTNTQKSIDSGLILGSAYALDGLIQSFEEEIGHGECTIVATGGVSQFIVPHCRSNIIVDNNLLLEGLYCYYKNSIIR
ncbi:MAG: type III pantothenate kinase [Oscillospiraceae bacterium]|nr:type III pantothenate kinase [Oscillospiraceae bacterium]